MNFLMRPSHTAHVDKRPVHEISKGAQHVTEPASTLEGLIAEESFSNNYMDEVKDEVGGENGSFAGLSSKETLLSRTTSQMLLKKKDGYLFHTLGPRFIRQLNDWELEEIKVLLRRLHDHSISLGIDNIMVWLETKNDSFLVKSFYSPLASRRAEPFPYGTVWNSWVPVREGLPDNWRDAPDICSFRSLDRPFVFPGSCIFLETLVSFSFDLHRWFRFEGCCTCSVDLNSIYTPGEPLWSKKGASETSLQFSGVAAPKSTVTKTRKTAKGMTPLSAVIDRGNFNASVSGGVARNIVDCCSLSNGDVVIYEAALCFLLALAKGDKLETTEVTSVSETYLTEQTSNHSTGDLPNIQVAYQLNDPKFEAWDEEDSIVMSWLWNNMGLEISDICMFLDTAKEVWDFVQETYSKGGSKKAEELLRDIGESWSYRGYQPHDLQLPKSFSPTPQVLDQDMGKRIGCAREKDVFYYLEESSGQFEKRIDLDKSALESNFGHRTGFSEPPGLVLNESEPCTPPNLRVMAKEKLVQGSTRPLQVYSRRKVPIFQPICVQEFEPVSVNEVPFLPLLFLTLNYHTKAYLTQMTMI
ncbi:hypothetical protein CK203_025445 [Vitis vinifera]|uniref:Uncharacterized protein n=1 Tax=Vitis vinifera TaxID=29760 RepID=A0A438IZA9_VITVI|nr:hypothetical protein CK203_025445 [Vitis vinifera]